MSGDGEKAPRDLKQRYRTRRQDMPCQEPTLRRRNFAEVALGLTGDAAQLEAYRCIWCKDPECVAGCPVGIDIPGFLHCVEAGDIPGAARVLKQTNLLPAICGRVCPQEEQCEARCKVGKGKSGVPVAIGRLERYVADRVREDGAAEPPELAAATGRRVAVVGAGPAGLTCAADLARLGHEVTVFEALHKPGGVLVYGIPEFRLPKAIVADEIRALEATGVRIVCNFVVGLTRTLDDLLREFDAIFVGTGAGLPYFMDIPGENLGGVYSANEYLTRVNLMGAHDAGADTPVIRGRNVAVVGGGNVAMDAARTALRLGAEHVRLVYRRSRAEMPARAEEVEHAVEEGVDFVMLTHPVRYLGDERGRVTHVECVQMTLGEPGPDGRRRPEPVAGSEHRFAADTVVVAIGNGPNPLVPRTTPGLETKKGKIVARDESGRTSLRGVFAGGDIVLGAATVILAMGAGRKAARAVDEFLRTGAW